MAESLQLCSQEPEGDAEARGPVGFGAGWGLHIRALQKDRVTAGAGNLGGRESSWTASSGHGGAEGGCGRVRPHHRQQDRQRTQASPPGDRRPAPTLAGSPKTTALGRAATRARQSGRSPVSRPLTTLGQAGLDSSCRRHCPRDHIPSLRPGRLADQEDRAWSSGLGSGLNSPPQQAHGHPTGGQKPSDLPDGSAPGLGHPAALPGCRQPAFCSLVPLSPILSPARTGPKEGFQRDFSMGLQTNILSAGGLTAWPGEATGGSGASDALETAVTGVAFLN